MKENKQSTTNTLCTLFNTHKLNVHVIDKQLANVKSMYVTIFFSYKGMQKIREKFSYMGTQPLDITCMLNLIAKWIHNFLKQKYFNHKQHHIFYKHNLHCIILKILICKKKLKNNNWGYICPFSVLWSITCILQKRFQIKVSCTTLTCFSWLLCH